VLASLAVWASESKPLHHTSVAKGDVCSSDRLAKILELEYQPTSKLILYYNRDFNEYMGGILGIL
jgi:hypothetical protein